MPLVAETAPHVFNSQSAKAQMMRLSKEADTTLGFRVPRQGLKIGRSPVLQHR